MWFFKKNISVFLVIFTFSLLTSCDKIVDVSAALTATQRQSIAEDLTTPLLYILLFPYYQISSFYTATSATPLEDNQWIILSSTTLESIKGRVSKNSHYLIPSDSGYPRLSNLSSDYKYELLASRTDQISTYQWGASKSFPLKIGSSIAGISMSGIDGTAQYTKTGTEPFDMNYTLKNMVISGSNLNLTFSGTIDFTYSKAGILVSGTITFEDNQFVLEIMGTTIRIDIPTITQEPVWPDF